MKIYIASDHGGFNLKGILIKLFKETGADFEDMGAYEEDQHDDYADFAIPLAEKVARDLKSVGILICRNGNGVCIAANKVKGARAGLSWSPHHAISLKNDDLTNILCLPADYIDDEKALEIVNTWLSTEYGTQDRYLRRLKKVMDYERK